MNLLQIYNRPRGEGGEYVVVQQIDRLLSGQGNSSTLYFDNAEWTGPNAPAKWKQALRTIYNPKSVDKLRDAQKRAKADAWLCHTVFPIGSSAVYREALRQNVPIIQYIHNFRPFSVNSYLWANGQLPINNVVETFRREIRAGSWQDSKVKTAILAAGLLALHKFNWLRSIKAWIATTHFMRDKFIEAGVPASDIFVLRQMWTPLASLPKEPEGNYFLFLGRLIEEKGVKVLCRAWDIVRKQAGPYAPRLIIAGSGPLESWVRQKSKSNPLVIFNGSVAGEQKIQLIASCRAMLAPSIWWEPLGLVTYEAYDFSKPMLAARSGGLSETVQHGLTGFLHQPGNATELAEQIIQVNKSSDLRRQMGQNGRAWLLQQPTPQQWFENLKPVVDHARRI